MTQNTQVPTPEMTVEESFSLIVSLVRQSKLSYQEHMTVEKAVQVVLMELNKKSDPPK